MAEYETARAARKHAVRSHLLALCHVLHTEAKAGGERLEGIRESYRNFRDRWPEVTRADIEAAIPQVIEHRAKMAEPRPDGVPGWNI